MSRFRPAILALIFLFSAVACSTPVPTGYLDHQSALVPGRYLDGFWCSERLGNQPSYSEIRLASIEPRGIEDHKGVLMVDAVLWLRAHLVPVPPTTEGTPVLLSFPDAGPRADLELAITEMTPGSAAARIWAGELGAGHAYVQVEGRLTDATDGELLCELVHRTRASGAIGLRDIGGDSGPAMVDQMLGMIARAIRDELRAKFGTPAD